MVGGWRRLELVVVLDFLLFVLVDVLYGTILWGITMKCRHFPTFFCAGTQKKKYVDVADRACRQNFADIVGCRRHVGDMSPTCATKFECLHLMMAFSYAFKFRAKNDHYLVAIVCI